MSLQLLWNCSVSKLELIFLCHLQGIYRFYGKEFTSVSATLYSVQPGADIPLPPKRNRKILWQRFHCNFQWPCSVFNLELIFLCKLGRIGGFYGKDVTAVSVTLFSVQTGADIPLPNGKNKKILWQGCHCSFSDPVQCPIWSWYSFAILEEWKDFVAKKSLKFQWPCSVFNLEVIFLCNLGRIGGFYGKDVTAASVNLFSVKTGADIPLPPIRNRKI